jgi:hypothetical protein
LTRYIQYVLEAPLRSQKYFSDVSRPRSEGGV